MTSHHFRALRAHFASAALALLVCACGGGSAPADPAPPAPADGALRTAQPGELVSYFSARIAQRSAQGLYGPGSDGMTPAAAGPASAPAAATTEFSSTGLQEAGVDEDDLLKTDGEFVHALHLGSGWGSEARPTRLASSRILADGSLAAVSTVPFGSEFLPRGMYVVRSARRIAVVAQSLQGVYYSPATGGPANSQVSLDILQVSPDGQASPGDRIVLDGRVLGTRMVGNVLYVASTWTPDLSPYQVPPHTPQPQVQATLAGLTTSALVPTIRVNGADAQPAFAESDCLLQPANASLNLQLTAITAIDLSTPNLERRSRCFVGDSSAFYMSPTSVYMASSRHYWVGGANAQTPMPAQATTDIHKFALQGLQVEYRGSGEVSGHLGWHPEMTPYRMSEYQGHLRVLTFTGVGFPTIMIETPIPTTPPAGKPSPATLTVLREKAGTRQLEQVGMLPNPRRPAPLGREGEQVYGVRFAGPQAYVVTFRRTDPLYVLDLSNPADPQAAGELAITGFSDYLFPLADGRLLGVGKEATPDGWVRGIKVSLFDVSNPAQPRELASRTLGEEGSYSALDTSRHGINILEQPGRARIALPVRLNATVGGRPTQQGLARFVVDTAAGTLTEHPLVVATQFDGTSGDTERLRQYNLGNERSVQTATATYYLTGGEVRVTPQP